MEEFGEAWSGAVAGLSLLREMPAQEGLWFGYAGPVPSISIGVVRHFGNLRANVISLVCPNQ